eukprot:95800-Amphidinium_carterae.1
MHEVGVDSSWLASSLGAQCTSVFLLTSQRSVDIAAQPVRCSSYSERQSQRAINTVAVGGH